MLDNETMHLVIRSVIRMGEVDREAGETAVRTNVALLAAVKEAEGIPDIDADPRNLENPEDGLARFREAVTSGRYGDLDELTQTWTPADYYAVLQQTFSYYGETV